jgi:hypothetical protein
MASGGTRQQLLETWFLSFLDCCVHFFCSSVLVGVYGDPCVGEFVCPILCHLTGQLFSLINRLGKYFDSISNKW